MLPSHGSTCDLEKHYETQFHQQVVQKAVRLLYVVYVIL